MWKQDTIQLERKHWSFEQKCVKVQYESTHQFERIGFDSINQSDANNVLWAAVLLDMAEFLWVMKVVLPVRLLGFSPVLSSWVAFVIKSVVVSVSNFINYIFNVRVKSVCYEWDPSGKSMKKYPFQPTRQIGPAIHLRFGCFVLIRVLPFIFPPKHNITFA